MLDKLKNYLFAQRFNRNQGMGYVTRNYARQPTFRPEQQTKGITYKAIDKIGQSLTAYEPIVSRPNGDAYENHPLLKLFREPNPRMNASDFIHLWAMQFEIYGETFWYKAPGERSRKPVELWLLNPGQVEINIDEGEIVGYTLHKHDGNQVPFLLEEIIHDKRPNPFNEYRGMSVLERAAVYVDTEISTSQFTLNYILNNASPSGIVSLPDMDREAFKKFAMQWRENYEGPQNAGKTAFLRGDNAAKFQAVGATLKDIDQKVTRDMVKEDVLVMLDVPKALLGMTDEAGLGRGNIEAMQVIYARENLEPKMLRLDRIYQKIAADLDARPIVITHENPVPEDREFMHKIHKDLVNIAITPNEVREQLGMQPIAGGEDLKPENAVPQIAQNSSKITVRKATPKTDFQKQQGLNEEQESFRKELVKKNDVYARKLKQEITKFSEKQADKVISNINATSKAFEEWLFNVKDESEALAATLLPILIELAEAQGEDVVHFITGELFVVSDEFKRVLQTNITQIAGVYNQDTLKALEKTLSLGQAEGESLAKLKKRVETVYSDAKGYRAERIARTESLRSSNLTAEQVYKDNGFTKVQWFINPGACQFCATYEGKTKTVGGKFNQIGDVITGTDGGQLRIEYGDVPSPPLHPNCTCSLVPVE